MKDSEFIDLLNLYLDHEITAADATRLEAEVQSKPARRRVYQDYCRMQKACKMLAHDFADEPAEAADRKIVVFAQARSSAIRTRVIGFSVAGGLAAAAACVAVVFMGHHHEQTTNPTVTAPVVAAVPAPTTQTAVAINEEPAAAHRAGIERQSLNSLTLRANNVDSLSLASAVQNDPHFAWLKDVNLAPVQSPVPADQLRFENHPLIQVENRTISSSNKLLQSDIYPVSVRFQK